MAVAIAQELSHRLESQGQGSLNQIAPTRDWPILKLINHSDSGNFAKIEKISFNLDEKLLNLSPSGNSTKPWKWYGHDLTLTVSSNNLWSSMTLV